jgi:hypothetical protein
MVAFGSPQQCRQNLSSSATQRECLLGALRVPAMNVHVDDSTGSQSCQRTFRKWRRASHVELINPVYDYIKPEHISFVCGPMWARFNQAISIDCLPNINNYDWKSFE